MNEISKIQQSELISAGKAEMSSMVNLYLENIAFNGGTPIKDLILIRKFLYVLGEMDKGISSYAMSELKDYDNSEVEMFGSNLKEVESGVKYDFSATSAWVAQKKKVEDETTKLKEIETFIKGCKSKTNIVDDTTGEIFEYFPASKTSSSSIRVTLK